MFEQLKPFMLMNLLDGESESGGGSDETSQEGGESEQAAAAPEWLSGVEADLISDPSMTNIKDMNGLVKSFIHSQKMIGGEKMLIPNKNATPEDIQEAYRKLGLPSEFDEYGVSKANESKLGDDFHSAFKQKAFDLNIHPSQAQGMLDFYEELVGTTEASHNEAITARRDAGIEGLKTEWGDGYQRNLAAANYAIDQFGGPELRKQLSGLGLINDPGIAKMFSVIGNQMSEDDFAPGDSSGFGHTPEQAQTAMNDMLADSTNPIHNPQHMNYKVAQEQYNKLAKAASK